jgi:hypothetical protein
VMWHDWVGAVVLGGLMSLLPSKNLMNQLKVLVSLVKRRKETLTLDPNNAGCHLGPVLCVTWHIAATCFVCQTGGGWWQSVLADGGGP